MEIYESDEYLNGIEMYYLVDGDLLKYTLHHRIKKLEKAKVNPLSLLAETPNPRDALKKDVEKPPYRKTSIYFKRDEFIVRVRVSG